MDKKQFYADLAGMSFQLPESMGGTDREFTHSLYDPDFYQDFLNSSEGLRDDIRAAVDSFRSSVFDAGENLDYGSYDTAGEHLENAERHSRAAEQLLDDLDGYSSGVREEFREMRNRVLEEIGDHLEARSTPEVMDDDSRVLAD